MGFLSDFFVDSDVHWAFEFLDNFNLVASKLLTLAYTIIDNVLWFHYKGALLWLIKTLVESCYPAGEN